MSVPPLIFTPVDTWSGLERVLGTRKTVLLSADVPNWSDYDDASEELLREYEIEHSGLQQQVGAPHAARIRDAASALLRAALTHGYRIVCRAHPSVTPMLLQAASDLGARKNSVIVFVSEYELQRSDSILPLCNWSCGVLVATASRHIANTSAQVEARFMREAMVHVPGAAGAVFIGGHREVLFDADQFVGAHPLSKRYAIESTGSAAEVLANRPNTNFHGGLDAGLLRDSRSYSLVAHRIMMDLSGSSRDFDEPAMRDRRQF